MSCSDKPALERNLTVAAVYASLEYTMLLVSPGAPSRVGLVGI